MILASAIHRILTAYYTILILGVCMHAKSKSHEHKMQNIDAVND